MNVPMVNLTFRMVVLAALFLCTVGARGEGASERSGDSVRGVDPYRTWIDRSGRRSRVPMKLTGFDGSEVTFEDPSGKVYILDVERLADEERDRVEREVFEAPNSVRIALVSTSGTEEGAVGVAEAASVENEVDVVSLRSVAMEPITIEETVETTVTVMKEVTECVPVIERYGLCGRRSRIVYRQITRRVPEQKTELKTVEKAYATVAQLPVKERSESSETIELEAPRSAGAIAAEVRALLDAKFPQDAFPMVRPVGEFPISYTALPGEEASDGMRYHFFLERASDPRSVTIIVYAHDPVSKSAEDAKRFGDARLQEIKNVLTLE